MTQISIMLYTRGKEVEYDGQYYIVDYVTLSDMKLYIRLYGVRDLVLASNVYCDPTILPVRRICN